MRQPAINPICSWLLVLGSLSGLESAMGAMFLVDSGAPNEASNLSVFADPNLPGAQFVAQEFTLASSANVVSIEGYLGGAASDVFSAYLTTAIGAGAAIGDQIASSSVNAPDTSPSAGDWVDLGFPAMNLVAGTYYVVFAGGTDGGFLPVSASNDIGTTYYIADGSFPFVGVDESFPPASDFSPTSLKIGLRVSAVPEPAALGLWAGLGLVTFAGLARRRRPLSRD